MDLDLAALEAEIMAMEGTNEGDNTIKTDPNAIKGSTMKIKPKAGKDSLIKR